MGLVLVPFVVLVWSSLVHKVELGSSIWNNPELRGLEGRLERRCEGRGEAYLAAALGNRTFGIPFDIVHVSIGHRRRRANR